DPHRVRPGPDERRGPHRLRHRLAVARARRPAARRDRGAPREERGAVAAVRAPAPAARLRRGPRRRQRLDRRHPRGRAGDGRAHRPGAPVHAAGLPLRGGACRGGAPGPARALGALPGLLLQLVLLPRHHPLHLEVGRRHGAHHRGRGLDGRPVVAGRDAGRGDPGAAPRALPRRRPARLAGPRPAQHRGVGLPDEPGLRLRQGARVGDPHDARPDRAVRAAAGPVRGAEVPRRRRVRPLDRPRVLRDQHPQPPQAARVARLQQPQGGDRARRRRRADLARGRAHRRPRDPRLAAPGAAALRRGRPRPCPTAPARL
ncbi:MAG: Glycosyltransferases involved in cell wall biogenesis, partial [uncultured Nocardioides sp.]